VRPKSPREEIWEGSRSGIEAARDVFNADEAADIDSVRSILPNILTRDRPVFTDVPSEAQPRSTFTAMIFGSPSTKTGIVGDLLDKVKVKPLKGFMNSLRVIKSEAEVANMRKAGQASGRAFTEAMKMAWTKEKDLETFLEWKFKVNGCEESAYVPVVAGGENANMIHYVRNDGVLK
jgi:intermediate cleaving peptidase 55